MCWRYGEAICAVLFLPEIPANSYNQTRCRNGGDGDDLLLMARATRVYSGPLRQDDADLRRQFVKRSFIMSYHIPSH